MHLDVNQSSDPARGLLKENVAQRLREEILAARIAPGEKIVEGKWAREYGVAQISVREALNILAAQGFVTKGHGRSARVLKLERADIIHIYQVRGVLEGLAARLIAEDKLPVDDLELAFDEIHHAIGTDAGKAAQLGPAGTRATAPGTAIRIYIDEGPGEEARHQPMGETTSAAPSDY